MARITREDWLLELAGGHADPASFAEAAQAGWPAVPRGARDKLEAAWRAWDAQGLRGFRRLVHLKGADRRNTELLRRLAAALEATHWRALRYDQFPDWAGGLGGRQCVEFTGPRGRALFRVDADREGVYLPQLAVERTGAGLGTALMEAIRAFAVEQRLGVYVYMVENPAFFRRFGWLGEDQGGQAFSISAEDLAAYEPPSSGPRR